MSPQMMNNPIIVCRPALAQDTPAMLEITRTIWDGHDYVPQVWDEWLRDAGGCLAVAEYGGKVVGLARLARFGDLDWWNQGLRVHPDFRGKGIASHLYEYILSCWNRIGSGTLRFTTTADRYPVHHLAERTGFERIGEFTAFTAPAVEEAPTWFKPITLKEAEYSIAFARSSALLEWQYGLINWGWEWTTPEMKWFLEAIAQGHAWWWKDGQGLLLTYIDELDDAEDKALAVALMAGPLEIAAEMMLDFRRLAAVQNYREAVWVAAIRPELDPILQQAGFRRAWDNSVYLYAKEYAR